MLSNLRTKIRYLINDTGSSKTDIFTYSTSSTFVLVETTSAPTTVKINDVVTTNYTFSTTTNAITISASLTTGDVVTVIYTYYEYSDTSLNGYIYAALDYLSMYSKSYYEIVLNDIVPYPSAIELSLIASIVYTLIEPEYTEYRLPNVTIKYPRNLSKEAKIEQMIHRFKMNPGVFGISEEV